MVHAKHPVENFIFFFWGVKYGIALTTKRQG